MGRIILTIIIVGFASSSWAQFKSSISFSNGDGSQTYANMEQNISSLLTEFNSAFVANRDLNWDGIHVTEIAKQRINSLWENGHFRCFDTELIESIIKLPGGLFQVRNLPLIITTSEGTPETEEGAINMTSSGEIDDLYFGIELHRYKNVMKDGTTLKDFRRRQIILDFLENFRTAYNRKDLDMIEKTFSENALIIVGKVIQEKTDGPDYLSSLGKKKVELVRYNKQQYVSNLTSVFSKNKFIDVSFDDIEVVKHGSKEDIYGVNLRQLWRSSSYSDQGYLFLMIDFEDESHPLVHVRAWQPEKDTQKDDVIELGDFDVVK
jgi:hypothetical protein